MNEVAEPSKVLGEGLFANYSGTHKTKTTYSHMFFTYFEGASLEPSLSRVGDGKSIRPGKLQPEAAAALPQRAPRQRRAVPGFR